MTQHELLIDLINQLKKVSRKHKLSSIAVDISAQDLQAAIQSSNLSNANLFRLRGLLIALLGAQTIYGKPFNKENLVRLSESFLVYARSIVAHHQDGSHLSLLAKNTNEQIVLSNMNGAEERLSLFLGPLSQDDLRPLFRGKSKTPQVVKFPKKMAFDLFFPFVYISWVVDGNMYLVTKRDKELMGLKLNFSPLKQRRGGPPKMGFSDFCHNQRKIHETALITADIPKDKLPEGVGSKSVGRYICIDHTMCNQGLMRTGRLDKIALFIDSVKENTPLIL
ncbi:MAG: hypothetical protein AAF633_04530 [Chloroflexota bacterium]